MGLAFTKLMSAIFMAPPTGNNWYVRPDGSTYGTGAGTSWTNAWEGLTAINWTSVHPGDHVWLAGGSYTNGITISKVAAVGNLVQIKGVQLTDSIPVAAAGWNSSFASTVVIADNMVITGQYIVLDTVTISPPSAGGAYAFSIEGSYNVFQNSVVTNYGAVASDQATAIGFTGGSFCTVQNCTIRDLTDIDVFHVFGHDNNILNNYVTNIQQVDYAENHTDFVQTFAGDSSTLAYNILIAGNLVTNSTCQLGNTETDGAAGIYGWTWRNNVFANIQNCLFWGIPNSQFYNNLFYNIGSNQGYAISLYTQTNYSAVGTVIVNNAFVANVADVFLNTTDQSSLGAWTNNYYATSTGGTKTGTQGSNAINGGAANFTNAAGYDFHPLAGSVLKGNAEVLSSFSADKDGVARGTSWTIGPYQ